MNNMVETGKEEMGASGGRCLIRLTADDVKQLQRIRELIGSNLRVHYPLDHLARESGMNEFKLKRGFRQLFHDSIYHYQLVVRMEKAIELLETTDRPVKQIARVVGYKSASSFIAAFRKLFEKSPFAWKRREEN